MTGQRVSDDPGRGCHMQTVAKTAAVTKQLP